MRKSNVKEWVINGLVVAMYFVLSVGPAAFNLANGAVQFRVSEGLNHLIVYNRKYFWGILGGVLVFDMWGPGGDLLNVLFGGLQTGLSLLVMIYIAPKIQQTWLKMVVNIFVFTVSMCLIAAYLCIITDKLPFWPTYATTALSELVVMSITAPLIALLNKVINFKNVI